MRDLFSLFSQSVSFRGGHWAILHFSVEIGRFQVNGLFFFVVFSHSVYFAGKRRSTPWKVRMGFAVQVNDLFFSHPHNRH